MAKRITGYSQYKNDFFNKLDFPLQKGKKLLDVGCGDGTDAPIFIKEYGVVWHGSDIYEHANIRKQRLRFRLGSILNLPYLDNTFDYVFTHDVLHHIDEASQKKTVHLKALRELHRVCKPGGTIIIVEGNRYNPLFYPHMVLMARHDHFPQSYFLHIVWQVYADDFVSFRFFEAHVYPQPLLGIFKVYEWCMEHIAPTQFLAYNAAIVHKQ